MSYVKSPTFDHDAAQFQICNDEGHARGCPCYAGGDVEPEFRGGPFVSLPMNAMRCTVCGHRLDDMGGCDSCAADIEAAMTDRMFGEDDDGDEG